MGLAYRLGLEKEYKRVSHTIQGLALEVGMVMEAKVEGGQAQLRSLSKPLRVSVFCSLRNLEVHEKNCSNIINVRWYL